MRTHGSHALKAGTGPSFQLRVICADPSGVAYVLPVTKQWGTIWITQHTLLCNHHLALNSPTIKGIYFLNERLLGASPHINKFIYRASSLLYTCTLFPISYTSAKKVPPLSNCVTFPILCTSAQGLFTSICFPPILYASPQSFSLVTQNLFFNFACSLTQKMLRLYHVLLLLICFVDTTHAYAFGMFGKNEYNRNQ